MKKIFLAFAAPVLLLLILLAVEPDHTAETAADLPVVHQTVTLTKNMQTSGDKTGKSRKAKEEKSWYKASTTGSPEPILDYALTLIGSPYVYGGTSSSGFDCSGFTSHVFEAFDVPISRSSTTQALDGVPVAKEDAQPGDLVIFTGTNMQVREPGHVGIVIATPGDTIEFVHSSSNGGVKISKVQGTRYDDRFLDVRRVL
jgi:cell wall-associated NlpC family hydrolase